MARLTNDLAAEFQAAARAGDPNETVRLQDQPDEAPIERAAPEVRMGVYAIRNTVDGALYVGSTPDIDRRWGQHRAALDRASHPDRRLQTAWLRYGAAAFELVILERVENRDSLAQAERRWIDRYSADDLRHVYNSQTRAIRKLRKLLTTDEAAQRLGVKPATLRRWVDEGLVSYHHASRRIAPH